MSTAHVGKVVDGRYRLDRLLGEGAAGAVYAATQLSVDRVVAVKLLHEANTARFAAEAKAIAKLNHTNVITLHDFGFDGELGAHFMVTEYAEGIPLAERMEEVMSTELILQVALEIASALHHAHANGVLHQDLKPENVILTRADGRVDVAKVLDFGLARLIETPAEPEPETSRTAVDPGLPQATVEIDLRRSGSNPSIPKPEPATIDLEVESEVEEDLVDEPSEPAEEHEDESEGEDEEKQEQLDEEREEDLPEPDDDDAPEPEPVAAAEVEGFDDDDGDDDDIAETSELAPIGLDTDVMPPLAFAEPAVEDHEVEPTVQVVKTTPFSERPVTGSMIVRQEDFETTVLPNLDVSMDSKFGEEE